MLASGIPYLLLLVLLSLAVGQIQKDSATDQPSKRKVSDPVSSFFSELGDLVLDVDRTIAVQSQPKIEHEANVMSQLLRPRADYFDRIQKNYRDMQKRLGNLIGSTIGFRESYSEHELSTVSPPPENFSPTIGPDYNPFTTAAEARKEKLKQRISKESKHENVDSVKPRMNIQKTIDESMKAFGKLSKAIIDDIGDLSKKEQSQPVRDKTDKKSKSRDECSHEVLEDPELEKHRQEKCSRIAAEEKARESLRKLMIEPKRTTEVLLSVSSDALDELSKGILGRSGDSETSEHSRVPIDDSLIVECSGEALEDAVLENIRKEKCKRLEAEERLIKDLNKILKNSRQATEELIPLGSKAIDDLGKMFIRRNGNVEDKNLLDILSDSSLDKQIRQLIKDHGSWILDYPLLKRWRQRNRSSDSQSSDQNSEETEHSTQANTPDIVEIEPTELYVPISTDHGVILQKSGETLPRNLHESSYYRIVNEDGDVVDENVDFVLDPDHLTNEVALEPKDTIILAFTTDGVPLKLRLGPEVDNPIQYLHKVLKSAGVTLNIPVESYDDLEPVGKEVLKLGSGILTRAVIINASNSNELKSLLKALMASKSSGKTTF